MSTLQYEPIDLKTPTKLESGRRICQLVFVTMDQKLKQGYSGKYLGQISVTGSRAHQDKELKK